MAIGCCWLIGPVEALGLHWFTTIKGSEYVHIYLWIMKDLSWTQSWYIPGHAFGIAAVLWSFYLLLRAVYFHNSYEAIVYISQLLWLLANFWWMTAELHDYSYPDEPPQYEDHQRTAGFIMQAALCWMAIYYIIIRGFKLFRPHDVVLKAFDDTGLKCRYTLLFESWRDYENVHILWWLGKDAAWTLSNKVMWAIFVIPTVLIAAEFVIVSLISERSFVDHVHYCAQLLWVMANIVWAFGEIFYPHYDDHPYGLGSRSTAGTFRWWSSWILVIAMTFVGVLYVLWVPLSLLKRLPRQHLSQHLSLNNMDFDKLDSTITRIRAASEVLSETANPVNDTPPPTELQSAICDVRESDQHHLRILEANDYNEDDDTLGETELASTIAASPSSFLSGSMVSMNSSSMGMTLMGASSGALTPYHRSNHGVECGNSNIVGIDDDIEEVLLALQKLADASIATPDKSLKFNQSHLHNTIAAVSKPATVLLPYDQPTAKGTPLRTEDKDISISTTTQKQVISSSSKPAW